MPMLIASRHAARMPAYASFLPRRQRFAAFAAFFHIDAAFISSPPAAEPAPATISLPMLRFDYAS